MQTRMLSVLGVVLLSMVTSSFGAAAKDQEESITQRDARMEWWREARFGMFVHWGLYSGLAGTWDGKPVGTKGGMEWIQQRVKADTDTYAKAAIPKFQPKPGFAREWASLAKQAGCRYLVFTTKHHEGFALHDSRVSDCDAGSVLHRDLVKEIVKACRAEGLKVGFYHSVIDWHHGQYGYALSKQLPHPLKGQPYPNGERDHSKYVDYLHQEVNELVSNYGPVDVLWWDYSAQDFQGDAAWRAFDLMRMVRAKQPKIIMNNRLFRSPEAGWASMGTDGFIPQLDPKYGDFITPEQHIPATGMPGVDWETCMTMNTTWGYSEHDHAWKSDETLIRNLIDIASKGGNYLLNIGPKGDGSVPEESVKAMHAIGAWMKKNGEAIYATHASPFEKLDWGRCTQKARSRGVTRLYLHVFERPADGKLVLPGLMNKPKKAFLLDGKTKLRASNEENGVVVQLPGALPDKIATVIALDIQGAPEISSAHAFERPIVEKQIVIAHRGASAYLPEHTLPAKALAYGMGADFLEQDVVLSKDNVPVVLHDVQIDTVSDVATRFPDRKRDNGRYYALDFTLTELKQLQMTERFDPKTGKQVFPARFPKGQSTFSIVTLEEELQFIQGLNKSTGRTVGVYPEIKSPAWHRQQGRDISPVVLDMLARYGYKTKADPVFVQCFDFNEVKRIRQEFGYQGRLLLLLGGRMGSDNTDFTHFKTKAGLAEAAKFVDGIGPSLDAIATGKSKGSITITDFVRDAHALKLAVHPYTARADELPAYASSLEEVLDIFYRRAGVDGMFTDFPDRAGAFLHAKAGK